MTTFIKTLSITVATTSLLLGACSTEAVKDPGAARARAALTDLQSNPDLANRAPIAIHDAEAAVQAAELPQTDPSVSAHLVYLADHRVEIATVQAKTKFTEDQRKVLSDQNAQIQLDARTAEADRAKRRNGVLQAETNAAQNDSDAAQRRNDALQAELAALQAKKTDRGMVLTLGDVLFSTGRADLKPGSVDNLDRLVTFLNKEPDRNVRIEGHTDNRGSQSLNDALSLKRADSVADYLTGRGIASSRVSATGLGFNAPIADNMTDAGRQANRRVEVIISDPPA